MTPIFTDKSKTCNNVINENARRIKVARKLQINVKHILQILLIHKNKVFAEDKTASRIKNLPPREARVSNNFPVSFIKKAIDLYYSKIKQIMKKIDFVF